MPESQPDCRAPNGCPMPLACLPKPPDHGDGALVGDLVDMPGAVSWNRPEPPDRG